MTAKKSEKLTPSELERRAATRKLARELADYHEAMARLTGEPERRRAVLGR